MSNESCCRRRPRRRKRPRPQRRPPRKLAVIIRTDRATGLVFRITKELVASGTRCASEYRLQSDSVAQAVSCGCTPLQAVVVQLDFRGVSFTPRLQPGG